MEHQQILSKPMKNTNVADNTIFNLDKTGFFWSVPPVRGPATKLMKGKKGDKHQITIMFTCNATGTENYIGKAAKPQCIKKFHPKIMAFPIRTTKTLG